MYQWDDEKKTWQSIQKHFKQGSEILPQNRFLYSNRKKIYWSIKFNFVSLSIYTFFLKEETCVWNLLCGQGEKHKRWKIENFAKIMWTEMRRKERIIFAESWNKRSSENSFLFQFPLRFVYNLKISTQKKYKTLEEVIKFFSFTLKGAKCDMFLNYNLVTKIFEFFCWEKDLKTLIKFC